MGGTSDGAPRIDPPWPDPSWLGPSWLDAVARRYGGPVSVVGSSALAGGYVSDDVRRYELRCAGRPVSVVWKRTTAREVAALRAVDGVSGIGSPWLLAHGSEGAGDEVPGAPDGPAHGSAAQPVGVAGLASAAEPADAAWVLMPHHEGVPSTDGQPVPDAAYEILARVHARYLGEQIPGLPVVDAEFWRRLCLDVSLPAIRGAAARAASAESGDAPGAESSDAFGAESSDAFGAESSDAFGAACEIYRSAEARLLEWSSDNRMLIALSVLPATLAHGDLHRGNILENPDGAVIIDWGGARIAPGGLDLAVLAEQGGVDHDRYHRRLASLTGKKMDAALAEVEQQWALAMGYVQYLGFAADCLGAARVGVMVERAAQAFARLGPALQRL